MTLRIKGSTVIKACTTVGFGPPLTIPGLQLWLDASDASTITTATGVSQWRDKSGNGNHASQSTGSAQPTVQSAAQNGLNTILFQSASSQVMSLASTVAITDYTQVAILRRTTKTVLCGHASSAYSIGPVWTNANSRIYNYDKSSYFESTSIFTDLTSYHFIACSTVNGGTCATYFDSPTALGQTTGALANAYTPIEVFGRSDGSYLNGYVGEVALYNRALNATEIGRLYTYLKAKWATP